MKAGTIEILLVEDNTDDVELTLRALKRRGLTNRIKVVCDGVDALAYLLTEDPDAEPPEGLPKLVLLDLKLPRMGGIEVIERIKGSEKTREIPVVVLTSSREECDLAASYRHGANSYIVKPVDFEAFMNTVGDVGRYWLLLNHVPE